MHPLDVWLARDAEAQSFARFSLHQHRPHVGLNHSTKISLARINFLFDATLHLARTQYLHTRDADANCKTD